VFPAGSNFRGSREGHRRVPSISGILGPMRILAIETSCDETAAAVVSGPPPMIQSSVVASQVDLHKKFGGVFPELASRAHTEKIIPVIEQALEEAKASMEAIEAIAVTVGPGLVGSLLIGVNAAKALSYATGKPLIPVNHLEGHIYANFVEHPDAPFPALALTVAGGHTQLILLERHLTYRTLGKTRDDSAGEAFDKVAKLLGLGYPGGPVIEQIAKSGEQAAFAFPRGMTGANSLDFSFSGLKTAVLYQTQKMKRVEVKNRTSDLVASFQRAVVDVLVEKTMHAAQTTHPHSIFLSGGVAANMLLRTTLANRIRKEYPGTLFSVPPLPLCTDNAAMIGAAAVYRARAKLFRPWEEVDVDPNAELIQFP